MAPSTPQRAGRAVGAALAATLLAGALVVPALGTPSEPYLASTSPVTSTVTSTVASAVTRAGAAPVEATDPVRSRRKYTLAADAPDSVAVGSTFEVVGAAANTARRTRLSRPVLLSERQAGSWKLLQRVRTSTYGGFAFTVDAGAELRLTDMLTLQARAENLFDKQVVAGISGTGLLDLGTPRTLWIGLRLGGR